MDLNWKQLLIQTPLTTIQNTEIHLSITKPIVTAGKPSLKPEGNTGLFFFYHM